MPRDEESISNFWSNETGVYAIEIGGGGGGNIKIVPKHEKHKIIPQSVA